MGLFGRKLATPKPPSGGPTAMPHAGRLLTSANNRSECVDVLERLVAAYREATYPLLPYVVPTGCTWHGVGMPPDGVVSFFDAKGDFVLACLWDDEPGTRIGLIHLDGLPAVAALPGALKQLDGSLSSIGEVPPKSVHLQGPPIPDELPEDLLRQAGRRITSGNVAIVADMLRRQVLVKSYEFLQSARGEPTARRFVDLHPPSSSLSMILSDLIRQQPNTAPYVQDLPLRIRALLLSEM